MSQVYRAAFIAIIGLVILASSEARALTFTPSEMEWSTWPEYCRVRYTVSAAGRNSNFANRYSPADVHQWQSQLGESWYALHHFCAGLARVKRAKAESTPVRRERGFEDAIKSFMYTIERTPPEHFMMGEMLVHVGLVQWLLGRKAEAQQTLDGVIASHPGNVAAYFQKAKNLRSEGKLDLARQVLLQGRDATGGESAELSYFLGLVSLELDDFESAQQFAREAYSAGYPLPALRDKLASAGYSL